MFSEEYTFKNNKFA
jgi:hypothetical protein